ncbi:MAG TPA: ATP-binding protein [Anaerolineae bacterium]|nr:ATP-binding protein [Anaerolineae bacterium]
MTTFDLILILLLAIAIYFYARDHTAIQTLRRSIDRRELDRSSSTDRLGQLEARNAALGDAPDHPLFVVNDQGVIEHLNSHAIDLLEANAIGRTLIEVTRSHAIDALIQATLTSHHTSEQLLSWNDRSFQARAVPIQSGGAVLVLEDRTAQQRADWARRDFVANVSHELRTPLASIRLLIETLLSGAQDDPSISTRMLTQVVTQVDALTQLAQELLDLSMIESGQMPMQRSRENMRDVIEEQLARFEPQAQPKKIVLANSAPDEVRVEIDRTMIGRVLGNLIHNALKFTPPNGVITIGASSNDRETVMSVSDTGEGIAPEELPRIFERFYKVDRARGASSGTGLGLSIARHVIEAHGGRIWAESKLGKGTTFYFSIPNDKARMTSEK